MPLQWPHPAAVRRYLGAPGVQGAAPVVHEALDRFRHHSFLELKRGLAMAGDPLGNQQRRWLLLLAAVLTAVYTWSSVRELSVLIEAEPADLPDGERSLLARAESNIASHLHLKEGVASEWRDGGKLSVVGRDRTWGGSRRRGAAGHRPAGGHAQERSHSLLQSSGVWWGIGCPRAQTRSSSSSSSKQAEPRLATVAAATAAAAAPRWEAAPAAAPPSPPLLAARRRPARALRAPL